jgi:drug/metabolite transporter (DMT)-like permease
VAIVASLRREERLGVAGLVGVAAIVAGVVLLAAGQVGAGAAVAPAGVALAAVAAVSQTAYFRAGASVRSMPPFMLAGAILVAGAAVTLPAAAATGGGAPLDVLARPDAALPLLWSVVVTAALAMTALLVGIRLVGSTSSAVIMLGEPVTNALAGAAVLGQPLPPSALGGIALLLAGAARIVSRKAAAAEFDAPPGSAAGVLPFAD